MLRRIATAAGYALLVTGVLLPSALLWDAYVELRYLKRDMQKLRSAEKILTGIQMRKVSVDEWSVIHLSSRDKSMEFVIFLTD